MGNTVKTVAYLRVSTARQDAGSQRLAILEYARREGVNIDDFIEATASTRTNAKRRRLDQLMATLEPGDRLVVSELSPPRALPRRSRLPSSMPSPRPASSSSRSRKTSASNDSATSTPRS